VNAKILHFIAILYVYTEYAFDYFMKWVLLHQAADAVPSHHITLCTTSAMQHVLCHHITLHTTSAVQVMLIMHKTLWTSVTFKFLSNCSRHHVSHLL
jgi:hypothetical protein